MPRKKIPKGWKPPPEKPDSELTPYERGLRELYAMRKAQYLKDPPETVEQLPPIPDGLVPAWERLVSSNVAARKKLATRYMLAGYSAKRSARIAGLANWRHAWETAREFGCIGGFGMLIDLATSTARLSLERLEGMLTEDGTEVSARDLAVVAGVLTDKVQNFEKMKSQGRTGDGPTFADALERLCAHVSETGGTLRASLELGPAERTIEIHPARAVHDPGNKTPNAPALEAIEAELEKIPPP